MSFTSNFTRGGQIAMHRLRMFKQISKTTFFLSLIGMSSFFVWRSVKDIRPYDLYLIKEYYYAQGLLAFPFQDKHQVTQNFEYQNGVKRDVRSLDITHNPYIRHRMKSVFQTAKTNLWLSFVFALFILSISIIYFSLRGRKQFEKNTKRGGFFSDPSEVSRLLQKHKQNSDLYLDKLPLVKDKETSHMLITGTTGAGKSNCFHTLLPQIRHKKQRAVVVDLTGDFVARYYRPETDLILNPFDERTVSWSIWNECETESQFDTFAEACIPSVRNTNDPFWDKAGATILSTALKKVKESPHPSIETLYDILVKTDLNTYHEFFANTDAATLTDKGGDKMTLSIRSNLASNLSFLKHLDPSKDSFSIRQWVEESKEDQWLFITARADQRKTLKPLISALMDTAINALMTLNPDSQRKLWFIMDELPALQKLPSLETGLAESRKYGGCITAGIQSIPQITSVYGRSKAQAILDLFNTRVFFRNTDPDTTHWVSKVLGEEEVSEAQENLSYGSNEIRDGVSLSQVMRTKPIVLPTEIANLNDLECFIKLPGKYPVTKLSMKYKSSKGTRTSFVMKEKPSKEHKKGGEDKSEVFLVGS